MRTILISLETFMQKKFHFILEKELIVLRLNPQRNNLPSHFGHTKHDTSVQL